MGCQVLFEFWRRYPRRVAGLIPICGPYGRPMDTFFLPPRITAVLSEALATLAGLAPWLVHGVARPVLRSPLPDMIARHGLIHADLAKPEDMAPYYSNLARMDLEVFLRMAIEMQRHDAGPWLHKIDVPTLIVAGERDTLTPLELSLHMRDTIRGAELLLLPSGSHAGIIEHPELINLRIEKFLRERVEPRRRRRRTTRLRQAVTAAAA
jgi:pimeloyl-ACP methyl ester carboxylesterase